MVGSLRPELLVAQAVALGIGLVLFVGILLWGDEKLDFLMWVGYWLSVVALVIPIIEGTITRGSRRWIELGFASFQPSEVTRIVLIWVFAVFMGKRKPGLFNLLVYVAMLGIPFVTMMFQPDLGSALVLTLGWLGVLLARGVPKKYLLIGIMLFGILLPVGWQVLHDYQKQRIATFLNPANDPLGSGYNVIQARLAVGSGQFWGKGLGQGTQSHLRFLPEHHTDFMYASLAEEFGFVGTGVLLGLYGLMYARMVVASQGTENIVSQLVILGLFLSLFGQTIINIGMNLGILPVTGVTLPLLSYGGSSLISVWVMLAIVCRNSSNKELKIAGHIH